MAARARAGASPSGPQAKVAALERERDQLWEQLSSEEARLES